MKTAIEMAREAGLHEARENPPYFGASVLKLERFAELVRADEREACAKVCDDMAAQDKRTNYYVVAASAIRERSANARARGQQ